MIYHYFKNIITPKECDIINQAILKLHEDKKLQYEGNDPHYKNSFGTGSVLECEALYNYFTNKVKQAINSRFIKEENTYARIYFNGSILNPHVDRPGLDLTLSLCTYSDLNSLWPIYVEMDSGKIAAVDIKPGDAALFMGTRMKHWREELVCNPEQMVIQSFYHWKHLLPGINFCNYG